MKKKALLELGQVIKVDGKELIVASISFNDNPGYPINFTYELIEKNEFDTKLEADDKAAKEAAAEAAKSAQNADPQPEA